jgi:putative addiction module killer protein
MSLIKIFVYTSSSGKAPFSVWLDDLDTKTRAIIRTRLDRIRLGNFGDTKSIKNGEGVKELRINYGPGYRIYYGMKGSKLVILLVGGDKKNQARDIIKAKQSWLDVKEIL